MEPELQKELEKRNQDPQLNHEKKYAKPEGHKLMILLASTRQIRILTTGLFFHVCVNVGLFVICFNPIQKYWNAQKEKFPNLYKLAT